MRALAERDLRRAAAAAAVLRGILDGNSTCKQRVLRIPLEIPMGGASAPPPLLLPLCFSCLAAAVAEDAGAGEMAQHLGKALHSARLVS